LIQLRRHSTGLWNGDRQKQAAQKSGAQAAQKQAQQADVENGDESQKPPQLVESLTVPHKAAIPRDSVQNERRECMGIEPTDGFLQAAHWF
jgi:hypothetical protein